MAKKKTNEKSESSGFMDYSKEMQKLLDSRIVNYITRTQYMIDSQFKKEYKKLREQYKGSYETKEYIKEFQKTLLESLSRNKELIKQIFKK